jgi:DNA-binding transcriptional regulator YdaS (Cro superfamily)
LTPDAGNRILDVSWESPLADTLYTRALSRAAEIQGSTQALASLLRVPEATLLRWMSGRAQMPVQAFLRTIELITAEEREQAPSDSAGASAPEKLRFKIGELEAHCARCDGADFLQADPSLPLRYISELACCSCGQRITQRELIVQLAKDAVYHAVTLTGARHRRQASGLKARPQLHLLRGREDKPTDAKPGAGPVEKKNSG